MGGTLPDGTEIMAKYVGSRRLMEIAVSTLATDRALLLYGVPGTAKSWVSEHLAAAVSGDSTLLIQGTAGTSEESIRYGWNYARLLSEGPSRAALVDSPMMRAMQDGKICRIEELTRIPSEVQDTLITVLSEKTLPVPELNTEIQAVKGFNVIATANNRDKGVNELSSALKRRFNTVILPVPDSAEEEIQIVQKRVNDLGRALEIPSEPPALEEIRRIVTIFRELRNGVTEDGKTKLKSPSGSLSTAEAISVVGQGLSLAARFWRCHPQAARCGCRSGGSHRQRSGAGQGGLARVPGNRGQRAHRAGKTCTGPARKSADGCSGGLLQKGRFQTCLCAPSSPDGSEIRWSATCSCSRLLWPQRSGLWMTGASRSCFWASST